MQVYRTFLTVGIAALWASEVLAQVPSPRFEVATLKLSPPPEGDRIDINLGKFLNGRLTLNNVTLKDAIKFAYELVSDDLISGPDWNRAVRFDIEALAPPETSMAQVHLMTRELLAERLHLVLRREEKTVRHLALVAGKDGAKLRRAKPDAAASKGPQAPGRIVHNQMPMSMLATLLSRFERQTIVDLTGLAGLFEVKLEWAPDRALQKEDQSGPPPDRPGLFAAVQEQLGLKLEGRRGPLEVLVVEQASKTPEGN